MKGRYNELESISFSAISLAVSKKLGWIFRELPIDVGVDAFIEQVEGGDPKGKFLAAQIKAGYSHFHDTGDTLTYYCSHIHYNYWLSLNIPVILIAYLPESEKIYWGELSVNTLKKTKKRWKIDIPKKQELNEGAKQQLIKLISEYSFKSNILDLYRGNTDPDTIYDIEYRTESLLEAVNPINNITAAMKRFSDKVNNLSQVTQHYNDIGLTNRSPQVKAVYKRFSRDLNILSRVIENEVTLYSELFSDGFKFHYEMLMIASNVNYDIKQLRVFSSSMEYLKNSHQKALDGIISLRDVVAALPNSSSVLKEAKNTFLQSVGVLIEELQISQAISESIEDTVNSIISESEKNRN